MLLIDYNKYMSCATSRSFLCRAFGVVVVVCQSRIITLSLDRTLLDNNNCNKYSAPQCGHTAINLQSHCMLLPCRPSIMDGMAGREGGEVMATRRKKRSWLFVNEKLISFFCILSHPPTQLVEDFSATTPTMTRNIL